MRTCDVIVYCHQIINFDGNIKKLKITTDYVLCRIYCHNKILVKLTYF